MTHPAQDRTFLRHDGLPEAGVDVVKYEEMI
jgi:hypothetical protein